VNTTPRITPRILKGFRDYLPETMIPRERLIDIARRVYRSYGFSPIDTPALEYLDILAGKGGAETDKQLYKFQDAGGRWVGLRFDLTVPLARFAAQHIKQLGTPLKRYHIASVWRGESPQRGRFREFMQCDFDTIGTTAAAADIETALVVYDLLTAVGISDFTICVNNRMLLRGLMEKLALEGHTAEMLRALDKLPKIGPQKVADEMVAVAGVSREQAAAVLRIAEITGNSDQMLIEADRLLAGSPTAQAGIERLREFTAGVAAAGVAPERLKLDFSIARGLDYYTGIVLETFLDRLPAIGSVCSGGRYDWVWTGCWRPWRSWAWWRRSPRPRRCSSRISTPHGCTTICTWPRGCARQALAWRSIQSPSAWASSCAMPTGAGSVWRL